MNLMIEDKDLSKELEKIIRKALKKNDAVGEGRLRRKIDEHLVEAFNLVRFGMEIEDDV